VAANSLILVVEDDAAIRKALAALLEAEGYHVQCAGDGREALARLRQPPHPRVILLDLSMPVMDGWQFRSVQRQSPSLADIPVILLSAEDDLPETAAFLGVADYSRKPIDFGGLLQAIRSLGEACPVA